MDKDKMESMLIDQGKSLERIETKIEHLPSKGDIQDAIDKHKDSCTRYKKPTIVPTGSKPSKTVITVGGLLIGAGGVLGYFINYFLN